MAWAASGVFSDMSKTQKKGKIKKMILAKQPNIKMILIRIRFKS